MQVSEWHNRSAKVGGIRRDCLREQGDPGARQLPRVSTSLARLSSLLSTLSPSFSSLSLSLSPSFQPPTSVVFSLSLSFFPRSFSFFLSFRAVLSLSLCLRLRLVSRLYVSISSFHHRTPSIFSSFFLARSLLPSSFPQAESFARFTYVHTRGFYICMRD